jgi:transposase
MMGRQTVDQSQLFYLFNLEEYIPADHLLRRLNPIVTRVLIDLREKLAPFYSDIGRPSIDPELMIRMLIVGYCYGIRFDRKLCEEVKLHLAYRWFCRLQLDDKVPDHSTFSVNRHGRFRSSDIFRQVFEAVVRACMEAGLVKGEGFAVDASVIEAAASRYHGKAPDEIDWSAPERQTRAVAEFLTALDDEATDADRQPPKVISPVDPCSAWTAKANKRVQFGYGLNYLIDIEYAVIVDVEATPARTYDEVASAKTMITRTEERLGLKPERLAADTAYGTGKFLGWVIETGIKPHIPVWDKSSREDGTFSRADFTFDKERNVYICPAGKLLTTTGRVHDGRTILYRASTRDCGSCQLKPKCTPNVTFRKIPRDVHEDARDATRALMDTPEFARSRNERKKVEMRFAHLKTQLGFERMRLRGLSGARDEFHLAAIVQNLKTLANYMSRPLLNMLTACAA